MNICADEKPTDPKLSLARRARACSLACRVPTLAHAIMRPLRPRSPRRTTRSRTVNFKDADGWKVASPQDAMIRGNWWEIFNEPELNALEEQLNINNQNIKVSFENFMEARALIAEARAQYWPTITANPSWNRSRSSGNLRNSVDGEHGRKTSTLWILPSRCLLDARFLGQDSQRGSRGAICAQASAADLELEKLTEQASLAQFYFEIRGQDMLQQILERDGRCGSEGPRCRPGCLRRRDRRLHLRGRSAERH